MVILESKGQSTICEVGAEFNAQSTCLSIDPFTHQCTQTPMRPSPLKPLRNSVRMHLPNTHKSNPSIPSIESIHPVSPQPHSATRAFASSIALAKQCPSEAGCILRAHVPHLNHSEGRIWTQLEPFTVMDPLTRGFNTKGTNQHLGVVRQSLDSKTRPSTHLLARFLLQPILVGVSPRILPDRVSFSALDSR